MAKEQSFGIIPLQKRAEVWHLFLIQHHAGHWGFPKGHAMQGETPQETAAREFQEETGLVIDHFLPFEPIEEHYNYIRDSIEINKTVSYFLAFVVGNAVLQEEEVIDSRWVPIDQASKYVTFEEAKNLCVKICKILEEH